MVHTEAEEEALGGETTTGRPGALLVFFPASHILGLAFRARVLFRNRV